jgi:hypothetical protein
MVGRWWADSIEIGRHQGGKNHNLFLCLPDKLGTNVPKKIRKPRTAGVYMQPDKKTDGIPWGVKYGVKNGFW